MYGPACSMLTEQAKIYLLKNKSYLVLQHIINFMGTVEIRIIVVTTRLEKSQNIRRLTSNSAV